MQPHVIAEASSLNAVATAAAAAAAAAAGRKRTREQTSDELLMVLLGCLPLFLYFSISLSLSTLLYSTFSFFSIQHRLA